LTLVLTSIAVWLAFKYINRDQERSSKEKTVAWLKSVKSSATAWYTTRIAQLKELSRETRAKAPDLESLESQDEDEGEDEDEAMSTLSASTVPSRTRRRRTRMGRLPRMPRPSTSGPELSGQGEPQEPTSSSENPNSTTAPHTPRVQDEATSIRSGQDYHPIPGATTM